MSTSPARALVLREREQQVLGGDVLVLERLGLVLGLVEELAASRWEASRPRRPGRCGKLSSASSSRGPDQLRVGADLPQDRLDDAVLLSEQRLAQVLGLDVGVAAPARERLRLLDRLLGLERELFDGCTGVP